MSARRSGAAVAALVAGLSLVARVAGAAPQVASGAPAGDIRDIRGPVPLPPPTPWALYGALALALLVIGFCTVVVVRRWRARRRTPYQVALARLRAATALVGPGARGDRFAEAVSDALRAYVEARFGLRAAHATSEEFLADLLERAPTVPALAPHRDELAAFLGHCDVAKFAGRDLPEGLRRELLDSATRLVEHTHEALNREPRTRTRRRRTAGRRAAQGAIR